MRRTARLTVMVLVVVASVALAAAPGLADLETYLDEAERADYTGRRLVMTVWDGNSELGVFDVTHAPGMTLIDGGRSSVGSGKVVGGDSGAAVVLEGWAQPALNERYSASAPTAVTRLGRAAESVDILEGDQVRARIVFDVATRVPLLTEIYDGSGELFRYSAMLEFDPNPSLRYADLSPDSSDYDVMLPVDSETLPMQTAGYTRADTYAGPDNTVQAFYTDGLFKFSIFEIDGSADLDGFTESTVFDGDYVQRVDPSELWVAWKRGGSTFVLVGDLPPDHLAQVLADLPAPDSDSIISRIWRGIFG